MKKTRFIPYGYTIREGRTVIEHSEAEIIREIFDAYIKGASLKDIAESLTQRKIPYTEKTDVWDKARIARIIENAKYIGDGEYDPIIDEDTYEGAVSMKAARQRNVVQKECEGIALIRNRVKCADCGSPMVRRISSKRNIKESWTCQNPECRQRLRISDGDLLQKITILMPYIDTHICPVLWLRSSASTSTFWIAERLKGYYGVPADLKQACRERLPADLQEILSRFDVACL